MIYKLFSQREEEAKGQEHDVYQYETAPKKLRVQIQQILGDAIGCYYTPGIYSMSTPDNNNAGWDMVKKILCREFGLHELAPAEDNREQVLTYLGQANIREFLDSLEVCCRYIDKVVGQLDEHYLETRSITQKPKDALEEINHRLRQSSLGFQYESGNLLRVDSQFLHEEVVKPAIQLLAHPAFEGAQAEFLTAHRLYRDGDFPQAIVEAGKAFESVLKAACSLKGWEFAKSDRAPELLKIIRQQGLWPEYFDKSIDQLLATLNSALPQLRNNAGAHGQGAIVTATPRAYVEYALNLSAAKILLIGNLALPKN
jgi:HEPN domain-containing protein